LTESFDKVRKDIALKLDTDNYTALIRALEQRTTSLGQGLKNSAGILHLKNR